MRRLGLAAVVVSTFGGAVHAQDYLGPSSGGGQETLYRYDDQEPWKHGWKKQMSYYEGFHSFRPYNYHHVFGQSQSAAAWGQQMPYSQQWWHRYHSPSAQYNHLQGQNPMAVPQYNTQQPSGMMPAPPAAQFQAMPGGMMMPQGAPIGLPPAPMNIDPAYSQPVDPMGYLPLQSPQMPVQ